MFPNNYWLYLQILFFLFITPGSPRIVMCSYTMTYGLKKTVWTALGDISANSLQLFFVVVGLGLFIKENPIILTSLKWIGVAYLLYLAFDLFKSKVKEIKTKSPSGFVVYVTSGERFCIETDNVVNQKLQKVISEGLFPVLCVGEDMQERNNGKTEIMENNYKNWEKNNKKLEKISQ